MQTRVNHRRAKAFALALSAVGIAVAATSCGEPAAIESFTSGLAQGTTYTLKWRHEDPPKVSDVERSIEAELERLDRLLSNYRTDSVLERFNASRSIEPQALPAELLALLQIAARVHTASGGCFDPTVRPLVSLWGFDGPAPKIPERAALDTVRSRIGMARLEIVDAETVRKSVPELELDMSSVGQAHTASRLAWVLEQHGIEHYLVEIGGEIVARGSKTAEAPWRIGIEQPVADGSESPSLALEIPDDGQIIAITTSGTYRHYFEAGSQRYSHILDPRTLVPVQHDLVAVTVMGSEAAAVGAWGTALLCLGPDAGMAAAEREGVAALFFVETGGEIVRRASSAFAGRWPSF